MADTTNAIADDLIYRSPDDIVKAVMAFAKKPRLIGNLMGFPVYVDDSVPPAQIEIHHADGRVQRFSIDHPYIKGTKLEAEARRVVGRTMTALTQPTNSNPS